VNPTTLEAALAVLRERVAPLAAETVPLGAAYGRVLAAPVVSTVFVPPFAKAMVDGYACRAEDTFGAAPFSPRELRVAFEVMPGAVSGRALASGEAARIMTGAPMPEGADGVVMLEHAALEGSAIRLVQALPPGKNVAARGEDVAAGDVVAAAGRALRPEDVGLLAAVGARAVSAHRIPSLVVFSSGDELLDAVSEEAPRAGAIFDANGPMLEALARREGALVRRGGILRDERATVRAALAAGSEATRGADVTVTSGAASKGKEDWMPEVVSELGALWVHGVSIRPAHPIGFGRIGERLHFLLPGNPVAAWIGFRYFVRPALRLLSGLAPDEAFRPERTRSALLARKIPSVIGRTDFARVRFTEDGRVEPLRTGGAGMLTTVTRADGVVVVPRELEGLEEGAAVEVDLL